LNIRPVHANDRRHIENFQRIYYDTGRDFDLEYFGVACVKCPLDLAMYQELIWETKPTLIVETGTFMGGSALYFAHLLDQIGEGRVLSIDLEERELPNHPRIDFLLGMSSTDKAVITHVAKHAQGKRVMVILDSDHAEEHVLEELNRYSPFVTKGCYLVVEDTNEFAYRGPAGPARALRKFQPTNRGFEIDKSRERLLMTCHPNGWLKKVR
jgi:cephalosporin hydroxylase